MPESPAAPAAPPPSRPLTKPPANAFLAKPSRCPPTSACVSCTARSCLAASAASRAPWSWPPAPPSKSERLALTKSSELGTAPAPPLRKKAPQPGPPDLAARKAAKRSAKERGPPGPDSPQRDTSTPSLCASHATPAARRAPPGMSTSSDEGLRKRVEDMTTRRSRRTRALRSRRNSSSSASRLFFLFLSMKLAVMAVPLLLLHSRAGHGAALGVLRGLVDLGRVGADLALPLLPDGAGVLQLVGGVHARLRRALVHGRALQRLVRALVDDVALVRPHLGRDLLT